MTERPVIFTPSNEPYLGRRSLHAFDELIVACIETNALAAPHTHHIEKTDLQWAACQIIPSGISLSLSIRELVRQGDLYGALVLRRSLAERAMILLYLHRFPEAVEIWKRGWRHRERPSLSEMLSRIGGDKFPGCGPEITRSLNSLTHGDPASAMWNLIETGHGETGHAASKILDRPDLCDRVSGDAAAWMAVLLGMMHAIFPDAFTDIAKTATSSSSSSESAENATVQFISLGYSRQSMNFRPILSSQPYATWLVKINAFFLKSLLWNETDALIAGKSRAFATWWLDLIRNVMVVAVLQYVARKSDKLAVKIIAEVSFLMLLGYCISYLDSWLLNPFFFIKNRRAQLLVGMVFGVALGSALLFSISAGIGSAIDEISRMQKPG